MVKRHARQLYRILLTCATHVHIRLLTCSITSVTFVVSLVQVFFVSRYVMFNILHSICVRLLACSFAWMVSVHVSAPYVIAGRKHEL